MEDTQTTRHLCGVCNDEWLTDEEYLVHVCPVTGFAPSDPQHLINSTTPDFAAISAAAIERGSAEAPATDTPAPEQPVETPTDPPADPVPQAQEQPAPDQAPAPTDTPPVDPSAPAISLG